MFSWGETLPTLPGEGLELRALEEADVPALYVIFGDREVMRYWSRGPYDSLGDAERLLDHIRRGFKERRLFQWGIAEAGDQNVVGTCTLFHLDTAHRRCEIGFALARKAWGRGLGLRAVDTVLRFAFESLRVHRVEADADPRNERSLRLLERLNFQREGLLRERYHVSGEVQDAVVLGLLRSEWRGS
jgi:RimJ/RimL family protein N-acetyltransferase